MMTIRLFLPRYLVWVDGQWPYVHVRKGRRVR